MKTQWPVFFGFTVTLVISGCGNNWQPASVWPAYISGFDGFSNSQKRNLNTYLDNLNKRSGVSFVLENPPDKNHFTINLQLVEPDPDHKSRAGLAILQGNRCTIQLSKLLADPARADYVMPVLWHEIAHCAGQQHTSQAGEIMSPTTLAFSSYTEEAIERFVSSLRQAISGH